MLAVVYILYIVLMSQHQEILLSSFADFGTNLILTYVHSGEKVFTSALISLQSDYLLKKLNIDLKSKQNNTHQTLHHVPPRHTDNFRRRLSINTHAQHGK